MAVWEKFLPVNWEEKDSTYKWSTGLQKSLQKPSQGSSESKECNGGTLAEFVSQVADQDTDLPNFDGIVYCVDEALDLTEEKALFFGKTLPKMADLA